VGFSPHQLLVPAWVEVDYKRLFHNGDHEKGSCRRCEDDYEYPFVRPQVRRSQQADGEHHFIKNECAPNRPEMRRQKFPQNEEPVTEDNQHGPRSRNGHF